MSLRQQEKDVFVYGTFSEMKDFEESEELFVFIMESFEGKRALVLLNFSDQEQKLQLQDFDGWGQLLGSNAERIERGNLELKAYEGAIYSNW